MAILFFDGFDRCTITKDLDQNFWSFEPQQPVEYEKYAFGGYSYDHSVSSYGSDYYSYHTPNNAIQPSGKFQAHYVASTYGGAEALYASGNYHPGFGQPLGFLALNNLDISDSNLLAPITYLQLSGFSLPRSGQSFLSARILGIETKDTNYAGSDKDGRFGSKHPLLAFCSGNTTGLILNIVKSTGNHISLVENQRMTIGLEVEQLDAISGTFDLNISNDNTNYQIRSVYTDETGYQSGDMIGRILTLDSDGDNNNVNSYKHSPISRWCHFQFGIIETGSIPYIQVKVDDVDLLSIPANDTITDQDFWEDKIYISGFDYDNIRFFNRTYNGSIDFKETRATNTYGGEEYVGYLWKNRYYMLGANTLIDDLILSDGSGTPSTFLGSNAKVVPFTPGINGNINNDGGVADGFRQWDTNTSSHRLALKNVDGDDGKINSSTPNSLTAVRYKNDNINISSDAGSQWRTTLEDAIGGIKLYTQAKKEFLDSAYQVIMSTGVNDLDYIDNVKFILNGDVERDTVKDRIRNYTFTEIDEVRANNITKKFTDNPSIEFQNSYIQINEELMIKPTVSYSPDSLKINDLFSFEAFVYFTGSEPTTLFATHPPTGYSQPNYVDSANYEVTCSTGYIDYTFYINNVITDSVRLYFPENLSTGEWHHIALSSFANQEDNGYSYPLVCFANGISGTSFKKYTYTDYNNNLPAAQAAAAGLNGYYYYDSISLSGQYINNIDVSSNSGLVDPSSSIGSATGSGLFSSPLTGTFSYTISTSNNFIELLNFNVNHSGYLVLGFQDVNTGGDAYHYHNLSIFKNDNIQLIRGYVNTTNTGLPNTVFNTNAYLLALPVSSGDSIRLTTISTTAGNPGDYDFYLFSGYIADDLVSNSLYYLPSGYIYNSFKSHVAGLFGNFGNFYDLNYSAYDYANDSRWPLFIGGNNLMSDIRYTEGTILVSNENLVRYQENFNPPASLLPARDDDYITLGEIQTLDKTRYGRLKEFYQYNNPVTNEVWTTGLINSPSGILLGVRKV